MNLVYQSQAKSLPALPMEKSLTRQIAMVQAYSHKPSVTRYKRYLLLFYITVA
jgi:hypothetical protein